MSFSAVVVILLGSIAASSAVSGLDPREKRLALIAFAVHVVGAFAHWSVMEAFYGNTLDAKGYLDVGIQLAKLMDRDAGFATEVARLAVHLETHLPFEVDGDGTSTGTMSAIAGFLVFLQGSSLLAMCLVASCGSWFGQLCLYRVAREDLDVGDRAAAFVGIMFVPSVVFWSAGFVKEAFVVCLFGVLGFSTYRLLRRGRLGYIAGVALGAVGVGLLKPYTLVAYVVGVAAFIYADRAWRQGGVIRIRLSYLVLAAVISLGGLVAITTVFPEYGADRMAESVSNVQASWEKSPAGSNVELGNGDPHGVSGQLQLVPLAFVNAFFRPAFFETKTPTMLVAAMENTLLSIVALSLVWARGGALGSLLRSPFLVFSVAFVLVFGIGVGLATRNLGALSRYRIPMMPFYATTLLVLRRRSREATEASDTARVKILVGLRRQRRA